MSWSIFGTNFSFTCQKTPVAAPTFISSTVRAATVAQNPFVHVKVHKISEHFVFSLGARTARLFHRRGFRFFGGAFKVQGEKLFEDLFVTQVGGPAVGGGNGGVEFLVREVEPRGALVVKVRERALSELGGALGVARIKARITHQTDLRFCICDFRSVYVAVPRLADAAGKFQNPFNGPFGRIEPAFA